MGRFIRAAQGTETTRMTALALGTVQFGLDYGIANQRGRIPDAEARQILDRARLAGIDVLDTAIAYGDSELRLGVLGTAGWQVVSKLPELPEACPDILTWVRGAVEGSLQRLRRRRLSGLLLHRPRQLLEAGGERLYDALVRVKQEGLVDRIGMSIYDPAELEAFHGRHRLDIVQAPFSILDRRLANTGWLRRLADQGVEVHVRSVFLQGLLLMPPGRRPKRFDRWAALWSRWDAWLRDNHLTPLQACLRYALSFPEISRVIVGVDIVDQLEEILEAAEGSLPPVPRELDVDDLLLINPSNWVSV
jgi:aryl-alcohol dehydrogenase-like predicted oxidoreductase